MLGGDAEIVAELKEQAGKSRGRAEANQLATCRQLTQLSFFLLNQPSLIRLKYLMLT